MSNTTKQHAPCISFDGLPVLLTQKHAAAVLGVSYWTVRRRIADETLEAVRVGPTAIRVTRESLLRLANRPLD
jgi:excisionase family DNA binding protein